MMEILDAIYYFYSGLNSSIFSFAGIDELKGVHLAAHGLKPVDFISDTLKASGFNFSYNNKFQSEKNFCKVILDT